MNTPDLTPAEWGVVLSELRDRLSLYCSQEKSSARIGSRYAESRAKLAQDRVNFPYAKPPYGQGDIPGFVADVRAEFRRLASR